MTSATCQGCRRPLGVIEAMRWDVCLGCTHARHNAVMNGNRCVCGPKRRPSAVHKAYSRRWVSCLRCLGTIKQLS